MSNVFVLPIDVGSGQILSGELGNASVVSGAVASGQIGTPHIGSGQVQQFQMGSGAINSGHLASGAVLTYSRNVMDDTLNTSEVVSGGVAVTIDSGGFLVVAQAGSNLRMPAIGMAAGNALSGAALTYVLMGRVQVTSGLDSLWSGQVGRPLYVAAAGAITAAKPVATAIAQRFGIATSGGLMVNPDQTIQSGNAGIQSGA